MKQLLTNLVLLLIIISDVVSRHKMMHFYCRKNEIIDMDISDIYFNYHGVDLKQHSMFIQSLVTLKKPIEKIYGDTEKLKGLIGTMFFFPNNHIE